MAGGVRSGLTRMQGRIPGGSVIFAGPQSILMEFLKDLWQFLKERKKFWLVPMVIVLLFLGFIIVFGGSSAVAPFIYTLF